MIDLTQYEISIIEKNLQSDPDFAAKFIALLRSQGWSFDLPEGATKEEICRVAKMTFDLAWSRAFANENKLN